MGKTQELVDDASMTQGLVDLGENQTVNIHGAEMDDGLPQIGVLGGCAQHEEMIDVLAV